MGPAELLIVLAVVVGLWLFGAARASRRAGEANGTGTPDGGGGPRSSPWWTKPWLLIAVQVGVAVAILVISRGRLFFLVLFLPFAWALGRRRSGGREEGEREPDRTRPPVGPEDGTDPRR